MRQGLCADHMPIGASHEDYQLAARSRCIECFPRQITPERLAQAAAVTPERHECDGCRGDGVYYGRGYVENGVFKGFTGKCFRCGGKGYQTHVDVTRNTYYDNNVRRIYA